MTGAEPGGDPSSGKRRRVLRVAGTVVFVASAIAVAGAFVGLRDYVQTSPRFCETCHLVSPEVAIWTESQHRAIRCQQCHHQDLASGLRILRAYLAGGTADRPHAPVEVASCAGCHATHDSRWPSIANSVGHAVHTGPAQLACTACHGHEMHFDRPARASCEACHETHLEGTAHEPEHCLACHNFRSAGEIFRPARADCLSCHERRDRPIVIDEKAPMAFPCYSCHHPHSRKEVVPCEECHPRAELQGLHEPDGHADCARCHEPHGWTTSRTQCFACHEGLLSHHPEEACWHCHTFGDTLQKGPT